VYVPVVDRERLEAEEKAETPYRRTVSPKSCEVLD